MLEVPENEPSGTRELGTPPCYRCLFEKPISDAWCDPATCEMLGHWLDDEEYSWQKYYFGWTVRIELEKVQIINSSEKV